MVVIFVTPAGIKNDLDVSERMYVCMYTLSANINDELVVMEVRKLREEVRSCSFTVQQRLQKSNPARKSFTCFYCFINPL